MHDVIERNIQSGKLSPAARDMATQETLEQYSEANGLSNQAARIELGLPKYSVHMAATNTAQDYQSANTLAEVREIFAKFAQDVQAEKAWASVGWFDHRDDAHMSHGDYPLATYALGLNGGVVRTS